MKSIFLLASIWHRRTRNLILMLFTLLSTSLFMFDWSESNITTAEYFSHFVFSCWLLNESHPKIEFYHLAKQLSNQVCAFFLFLHRFLFYFIYFLGTFVLYVKRYSRRTRELPEVSVSSPDKLMEIEWRDNKISAVAAIEIKTATT